MNTIRLLAVPVALFFLSYGPARCGAAQEGVALGIVYDTSGSMKEPVADGAGKQSPKYIVANRALTAIANRLQGFITNAPAESPRKVEAGLYVFSGAGAKPAIPFGPFEASTFRSWAKDFSNPSGGTPLGTAVSTAARAVLNSNLSRKHVLVITDGMSNVGPDPATAMPELKRQAEQKGAGLAVHFIAFDVDAKVFNGVKKLGATVVGAANETQLNEQLNFILEKKILLEDEEPPKPK